MRKLITALLLAALTVTAAPRPSAGQADMGRNFARQQRPLFILDAVTLRGQASGKTRVLVYLEMTYEDLQFVRSGRGYEASYQVDLSVLAGQDENAPRVTNKLWKETVVVRDFEATNSQEKVSISETSFEIPSGTYMIIATLSDLESKEKATVKQTLEVPAYGLGGLEVSDLLVADAIETTPDGVIEIVPNVNRVIQGERRPIFIYYEVYPYQTDSLDVYARLLDNQGEIIQEIVLDREAVNPVTRDFLKIPLEDLSVGRYVFEMQVSSGDRSALKGTSFRIKLSGVPGEVENLETAIRQLRYIAKTSTLKRMRNAPPDEREQMFNEFWRERDPSPDTRENELMQEYYSRVARANQLFGSFRQGWETDRGEVYIRFGPPDEVERHPYEVGQRPYEIWYYYDIQRRFIFVDEMGYGEYRLVTNLWR